MEHLLGDVSDGISWDGRRICSVVQGADGYAAFHYMIFYSTLSANVEVTYISDNCPGGLTANAYGVILAHYSGYAYSTDYDKMDYQSRPRNNAEELKTNFIIPLSKSVVVVVVPVDSSPLVETKLRVSCDGSTDEEVVCGVVEFLGDMSDEISETIQRSTCYIQV